MFAYNVECEAGGYRVRIAPDHAPMITSGGERASFLPGWTPRMVLGGIGDVSILDVVHEGGARAAWYLDAEFGFIGNRTSALDDNARAILLEAAKQSMQVAWHQLGCASTPSLDPRVAFELRMLREFVVEAAAGPAGSLFEAADAVRLNDHSCATLAARLAGRVPNVAASIAILHQTLERDFFADIVTAAATGRLEVASPVDGRILNTDIGLCVRQGTIAYRFTDTAHDLTFYVLGSFWRMTLAAIYIPTFKLTIQRNALNEQYISEFLGEPVDRALFTHILTHADDLVPYLAAPSRVMTLIYMQNHLGHHLFNELGGLDRLVATIPPERMPPVLMVNAYHSEMYGRIDEIFPELDGKVDRTARNPEQVTQFAYRDLRCLIRPTDDYVSAALARRIIALNERSPSLDADKALFARLSAAGTRIVLLGLRVENRTVVDPIAFFAEVIDTLRQSGRLAVVFDGHNGILGDEGRRTYDSHMEGQAVKAPAEVEADIVQAMRDRYGADGGVTIISTVGAPMCASIYWCNRAAFFVTPWGAGLAKYRWICNRPGLVVAGQRFLRHAGEKTVHLYDSPEIMENPTPLSFVSEDEVADDVDAPFLVGIKDDNRVNFTVRPEALRARLAALVAS